MYHRRVQKVVKMPKTSQWQGPMPEVIDRRRVPRPQRMDRVRHDHYHHFHEEEEPALTPQDFCYIARGIESIEKARTSRHMRWMSTAKLAAVCLTGGFLALCGLVKLIG